MVLEVEKEMNRRFTCGPANDIHLERKGREAPVHQFKVSKVNKLRVAVREIQKKFNREAH